MSWFRRLLQYATNSEATISHSRSEQSRRAIPTVKFDPATVSQSVKANLRANVESLDDVGKEHIRPVYEAALGCVLAGGDLHVLSVALMKIEGMPKERVAEIARSLHSKAKAQIDRERQASLGITHAKWMYSNAPCMRDPRRRTAANVQQDAAHRVANGERYEISKGLFVDGKLTWPGVEEGCKCSSRAILPGLKE
jgi:uncharacterized protein with gpF-like domain